MNKTILISNKAYGNLEEIGRDYCHDSGNAYTNDRYFSIINDTIDYHLKLKNIFLYWWVNFWYGTSDYKKRKDLSNKRYDKIQIFKKIFFILCVIGLILTLIFGLAIPVISSATTSILLVQGKAQGVIYANGQLIGYVFTNSEAASIIYNLQTTMNSMTPSQLEIMNTTLNNLHLTTSELQKYVVIIGSSYMIINMTSDLQQVLYAFIETQKDYLGHLDISNLNWNDLILSTNQAGQAILIPKIWIAYFRKSDVIVPIVFTLFFIIIIYLHERRRKKIIPKINSMSMQDYVTTKLVFLSKYKFLLFRTIPMLKGVKELNHRFIFNSEDLGTSQIYTNLKLMNFLYSTFIEINCIMVLNVSDDSTIEKLQKICKQDFNQNINLIVIDDTQLSKFKSDNAYGYLFDTYYLPKLTQKSEDLRVKDEQDGLLDLKIKFNEKINRNYNKKLNDEINKINRRIQQLIFKNRRKLSPNEQKIIIEKEINNYNEEKKIIISRYQTIESSFTNNKEKQ